MRCDINVVVNSLHAGLIFMLFLLMSADFFKNKLFQEFFRENNQNVTVKGLDPAQD